MVIKYAILAFNAPYDDPFDIQVGPEASLFSVKGVSSLIEASDSTHWKEWLGELRWTKLSSYEVVFATWCQTNNPDVLDAENKKLMKRCNSAYNALLLNASTTPFMGESATFTGTGEIAGARPVPRSVREFSTNYMIVRPLYDQDMDYLRTRNRTEWLTRWPGTFSAIDSVKNHFTAMTADAFESLQDSRMTRNSLTSIARFVEAAETVLAMPKSNAGAKEFVRRASMFAARLNGDVYLNLKPGELDTILEVIYKVRNARNHGKGTYESVKDLVGSSNKDVIETAVARWEYIAERIACDAIMHLLSHKDFQTLSSSRAGLENAWDSKQFP